MLLLVGRATEVLEDGDRGLANVVGFIVLFSFLIVSFTVYQGIVVPDQNRRIEFDHNREVQGDMQDLREVIFAAARGIDGSVSLKLGAEYPRRTIARNLGTSAGTLQTVEVGTAGVTVENITAIDTETDDYVGNESAFGPFETKSIAYQPTYTRYTNAPTTVYENTLMVNQFSDGTRLAVTDQSVVNDRKITVIVVTGRLSEGSTDATTVDASAASASVEPVAVTPENGPLNITIPTQLSAANWTNLLANEQHVKSVRDTGENQVSIILEEGVTYDLRMAKVGVGTGIETEDPWYVTDVAGNEASIPEGGSERLVVEVRDRFNNPVSNVSVEASLTDSAGAGDSITPGTTESDSQGRAKFTYDAPADVDQTRSATITVFFDSMDSPRQNVTFEIDVLDTDGSGVGPCGETVGRGNAERWCPAETSFELSQYGGVLADIGSADSVNLSDPMFSPVEPDTGATLQDEERFRLVFVLERDQEDLRGTTRYLFAVPNVRDGFSQTLSSSGTSVTNRNVIVYKDVDVNGDGSGYTEFVNADLKQKDLNDWYNGAEPIDLLEESHYTKNPNFGEIRSFMRNNKVRIYFAEIHGRVNVTVG